MTDRLGQEQRNHSYGVVDIGSNSVRMVVYEGPPESPIAVYNEKVMCALGYREPTTGNLRGEAMDEALFVLTRFRALLTDLGAARTHVFATAASREAPNGPAFLAKVRALGLPVRLLTGAEEARYAALGILSSVPELLRGQWGGLAGDIGGGSLELAHIAQGHDSYIGRRVSLPLGALRLSTEFEDDLKGTRAHVRKTLDQADWLEDCPAEVLYVVGGAWRALARIAIVRNDYPLDVLDRFSLTREEIAKICAWTEGASLSDIADIDGVQKRRVPTLPHAAIVLDEVLQRAGVSRFEVSASGVREGVLYADLDRQSQEKSPLLASSRHIAASVKGALHPSPSALTPLLLQIAPAPDSVRERWVEAAATLSGLYASTHPDERARQAGLGALALPLKGVSHPGRVFIAAALATSHGAGSSSLSKWLPMDLLEAEDQVRAELTGLAIRFLIALSPLGSEGLESCSFFLSDESLSCNMSEDAYGRWGRAPQKRFLQLAEAMERIAIGPDGRIIEG